MFTGRQSKILEILLNNVQGVSGTKLSEYLDVSSRTIRNEIGEINRSWEGENLILASKKTGYFIDEQYVDLVREYLLSEGRSQTEEELIDRGWVILGMVLETGRGDLFDIGERLSLSETAIYKETVKFQKRLLAEYECEMLHMSAERLWIEGNESEIRQTLFRIIKDEAQKGSNLYFYFLKTFLFNAFDQKEYELLIKLIKGYFDSRYIQISDANLYMIVSAVYITIVRNCQGHKAAFSDEEAAEASENREFFEYLKGQGFELSEGDLQILRGLLHGFKLTADPVAESAISNISVLILEEFCNEVMEKYHFDLWQSQSFYENLLIHVEYMIRRLETGYEVKNPILADIKNQYPYACEIAMLIVPIVYRYKNCFIRDDEVSYIAIFVEHFLENVNQKLKAMVISSARFSISTIVGNWIRMNFQNQIEIVDMIPQHRLEKYLEENPVDLIISTMDSVVHPVIATFKIEGLPNHYTQVAMNALIHKIRMNYRFREIIKEHFHQKTIRIYRDDMEFEQVIRELSEALKAEDCIYDVDEYVNDVLQREINYPTFIGDCFMIPHPLVTFAKKTAIGAAVLKKPIRMQKKEIKLIFLLAMERKQNDQIGVLFQFFKHMALEQTSIGMLSSVENEDEFIDVLIRISNRTEIG